MDRGLLDYWKRTLDVLDPWREIRPDEVDALYVERPYGPHADLATHLRLKSPAADIKVLFIGARGAGKTTELTRLAHELRDDFCIVQTDLHAGLPEGAGTLAIVTLLGAAAASAIQTWSSPDGDLADAIARSPAQKRLDLALRRFGDTIPSLATLVQAVAPVVTLVEPTTGALMTAGSKVVTSLAETMRRAASLRRLLTREPLRAPVGLDRLDDAQEVVAAVNDVLAELTEKAGRPPLLLAEGLDKRTELAEVKQALASAELLRNLAAPLILTGPVSLRHEPRLRGVPGDFRFKLIYNMPVCHPAFASDEDSPTVQPPGIAVMLDLYHRRQRAGGLPSNLIADALVERAALMSAGIVRQFLEFLHAAGRAALAAGRRSISSADLESALHLTRLEMTGYLRNEHYQLLGRVLDEGGVPIGEEANTLLFENFIACYPNGEAWFRPHELIVESVRKRVSGSPDAP